jgi:hypothetical protein
MSVCSLGDSVVSLSGFVVVLGAHCALRPMKRTEGGEGSAPPAPLQDETNPAILGEPAICTPMPSGLGFFVKRVCPPRITETQKHQVRRLCMGERFVTEGGLEPPCP